MPDYEKIVLYLPNEVQELMEERRILREDIQRTIQHGERAGGRFFDSRTGHFFSSSKPDHVTYWVEYTPEGEGFRVYRVYSHRMEIVEGIKP